MKDQLNFNVNGLQPYFTSPSFSWAWHTSAPACFMVLFILSNVIFSEGWLKICLFDPNIFFLKHNFGTMEPTFRRKAYNSEYLVPSQHTNCSGKNNYLKKRYFSVVISLGFLTGVLSLFNTKTLIYIASNEYESWNLL